MSENSSEIGLENSEYSVLCRKIARKLAWKIPNTPHYVGNKLGISSNRGIFFHACVGNLAWKVMVEFFSEGLGIFFRGVLYFGSWDVKILSLA